MLCFPVSGHLARTSSGKDGAGARSEMKAARRRRVEDILRDMIFERGAVGPDQLCLLRQLHKFHVVNKELPVVINFPYDSHGEPSSHDCDDYE